MDILHLRWEIKCTLWIGSEDKQILADNISGMVLNAVAGDNSKQEVLTKTKKLFM